MSRVLDSKIASSSRWVAVSFGSSLSLSMLTMIILARLLTPADFGVISLAAVFMRFTERFQDGGMHVAQIKQRDNYERAAATAFLFVTVVSVALYALLFAVAPLLAAFFDAERLDEVIRVLALVVVVRGIASVQTTRLNRELEFRSLTKAEVVAAVCLVTVSVGLAVAGFGVWSLVAGRLAEATARAAVTWFLAPPLPRLALASFGVLRELLRYGRFVSATRVLLLVTATLDNVVIGRFLGTTALGFYSVAFRLAAFPSTAIGGVFAHVMLPAYAIIQDDVAAVRAAYVTSLQRLALVALPVSVAFVVAADPIVTGLFGERWEPAVDPLRILGVYGLVRTFSANTGPAFQALGHAPRELLMTLPSVITLFPLLYVLTSAYGMQGAAAAMLVSQLSSAIPRIWFCFRVLELAVVAAVALAAYAAATTVFARPILLPMITLMRGAETRKGA